MCELILFRWGNLRLVQDKWMGKEVRPFRVVMLFGFFYFWDDKRCVAVWLDSSWFKE